MSQTAESPTPNIKKRIHRRNIPKGEKSRLIDINEASYRTGLGKSTIWKKIADDGFVKPVRISKGMTRFVESDVDAWIESVVEAGR